MGNNKQKKKQFNKAVSFATAVAVALPAVVAGVPAAHAAEAGTYTGEGYTASWEAVDGGVRLFNFNVTALSGATTISLPAMVEGQPVVSFDNKSLETFSRGGFYAKTGSATIPNYLAVVNVPSLDVQMEFDGHPFAGTSASAWSGAEYKHTDENGVNWQKQFKGSGVYNVPNVYVVSSNNTASPLQFDEFIVPDNVFGAVKNIGAFEGLDIGVAKLPDSVAIMMKDKPFGTNTTVREIDISNLKNITKASQVVTLAKLKGQNTKIVLSQSFMTARGSLDSYMSGSYTTAIVDSAGDKLTTLAFGDDVTDINTPLMKGNGGKSIGSVLIPEGVTNIGNNAFRELYVGSNIALPSTLRTIGNSAFESSEGAIPLHSTIPNGVTSIGNRAFYNVDVLKEKQLVIPKSVVSIGTDAFNMYNMSKGYNKVVVLNKYLKYQSGNKPFKLTTTGIIQGYVGSTTESVYATDGFVPLDEALQEPTISSNLVDGQTYNGSITPTFDVKNADTVTYTLNGQPYDGVSPITEGGQHTLKVVAANDVLSATKIYTFTVKANQVPETIGTIENQTINTGDVLSLDLNPLFSDADGDALTYEVTTSDEHASEVWTNTKGQLKFTSDLADTYDITVKATDGKGFSEAITFSVDVTAAAVTPPPVTDGGQVGTGDLEKSFSEVLNVAMVGLNKEKTINLAGLLNITNMENPTITVSGTNNDAIAYDFNAETQEIKLTNPAEGFSNIQVVAQSGNSKVVILLMVDSYEQANFGAGYVGNGQIYAGLEAYVIPISEVFTDLDMAGGDALVVTVAKNQTPAPEQPVTEPEQTTSGDTATVAVANTRMARMFTANTTSVAQSFGLNAASGEQTSAVDIPSGVDVAELYNQDGVSVKLAGGRLIVEGAEAAKYDIAIDHKKSNGAAGSKVNFTLDVLANASGGEGETNPPVDPTPPTDGGNGGETNPPVDPTPPTDGGNGGETNPPVEPTPPTDGGNGDGGTNPPVESTPPTDGGNGDGGTNPPVDPTPPTDGGNGGETNPPVNPTPPTDGDKGPLEDILVDIEKDENGDLIVDVTDDDDIISDGQGTITITNDKVTVEVDGVEKEFDIDLGDYDFSDKRAVHINKGAKSTAMHYTTDESLIITTHNLDGLVITSRDAMPFKDVSSKHRNNMDEIDDMYNYIITTGTTATTYSPNASITRAQFAAMIARALELPTDTTDYTLRDLSGKWYAEEVQALVDLGIVTGFGDGTFGGHKQLTRQQAAAMIARMLEYLEVDTQTTKDIKFADEQKISDYAKDSVHFLAQNDILVNGENVNFNPHTNLTRDQMAKVLMRALRLSDFY